MHKKAAGPSVCVHIVSLIAMLSFGLLCILKGISFGLFTWWYIVGASSIVAAAFTSFRIYEVCILEVCQETASELSPHP